MFPRLRPSFTILVWLILILAACSLPTTTLPMQALEDSDTSKIIASSPSPLPANIPTLPPTRSPDDLPPPPTPNAADAAPEIKSNAIQYTVQANDTLGIIAEKFNVDWEDLALFNQLSNPNALEIGQLIMIPSGKPEDSGPILKLIPDSELPYGPAAIYLDIEGFVEAQGGYLAVHRDTAVGLMMDGTAMISKIARDYSVNPKILLTLLELQSGWVRNSNPRTSTLEFPMGHQNLQRIGLYAQLAWAADQLNEGYYQWKIDGAASWVTQDGVFIAANPGINAGTAAIQGLLAKIHNENQWLDAISSSGFLSTYQLLFGYPFDFAIEPSLPLDLEQPEMQLPFEESVPWVFSGGPHSGWGYSAAWAALDFAPRGEQLGCWMSADWVVAAADGLILRADEGAVVQDLDGDGFEQSGWTILYMHVDEYERVASGTFVEAGQRIGHPSCEGGLASASHLHIARRYNGEWIPAAGNIPFILDGWISLSKGVLYDGTLEKNGQLLEACECYDPPFMLQR